MNNMNMLAVIELREIISNQQIVYAESIRKILKTDNSISKKINNINSLKVGFQKPFELAIKDYLYVVCLFSLKQVSKELEMSNPKKLSIELRSWINATSQTVTGKYLTETNQSVTLPVIDNIGRGLSDNELVYRVNLLFDEIKLKKPDKIIGGIEGKGLLRGRNLAVQIYNKDVKLETEGFSADLMGTLKQERVVAAQWSAILDKHVCELCASLDGRIIDIDSPDYAFYSPGEIHLGCRCLWVYIRSSERPENRRVDWKVPKTTLLKKYAKPDLKKKREIEIEDEEK